MPQLETGMQVNAIALSTDLNILVSAHGRDLGEGGVMVWGEDGCLMECDAGVWAVVCIPGTGAVVSGDGSRFGGVGMVTVWDIKTGDKLREMECDGKVMCVDYAPQINAILSSHGFSISVWDFSSGALCSRVH